MVLPARLNALAVVALLSISSPAGADQGPPYPVTLRQPDGSPLTVRYLGDERNLRLVDAAGYTLAGLDTPDGTEWHYATLRAGRLVPSGLIAGRGDPVAAGLEPGLRESPLLRTYRKDSAGRPSVRGAHHRGRPGLLRDDPLGGRDGRASRPVTLLARFPDGHPGGMPEQTYTREQFGALLWAQGLDAAAAGLPPSYGMSVWDYYHAVSRGGFGFTAGPEDVADWVTVDHGYSWYVDGQQGFGDYPENVQGLVEDACRAADDQIDFSQYDTDGDGWVDEVIVVAEGWMDGSDGQFWPHQWSLPVAVELDGVLVSRYFLISEQFHLDMPQFGIASGDIRPIGTFCHEQGHVFVLPDLYDTDYSSRGIGYWGLMGAGNWLAPNSPAFPSAWSRIQLGWETPAEVPHAQGR